MTYTFGGATGDDATNLVALTENVNADNHIMLVAGWWYPTTLTGTRVYWGCGPTIRLIVDSTNTDELRLFTNNVTTPGQWLTSGADLTMNRWWFSATLLACENTTVPGAVRVWVGNEATPPQEVTVTNPTVRVGNYTSTGSFTIGNQGATGTVAFQGDIGWVSIMTTAQLGLLQSPLPIAASGVISNDEAEHIKQRWVTPLYLGVPDVGSVQNLYGQGFIVAHWPGLSTAGFMADYTVPAVGSNYAFTINGATLSQNLPPSSPLPHWPTQPSYVRR